jgi:hypothetical protein
MYSKINHESSGVNGAPAAAALFSPELGFSEMTSTRPTLRV